MQNGMLVPALEKTNQTTLFHKANMIHPTSLTGRVIHSSRMRPSLSTLAWLGKCIAAVLCAIHEWIAYIRALGVSRLSWQWPWMPAVVVATHVGTLTLEWSWLKWRWGGALAEHVICVKVFFQQTLLTVQRVKSRPSKDPVCCSLAHYWLWAYFQWVYIAKFEDIIVVTLKTFCLEF